MKRILYCDRSRAQLFRRCPRARYWEYESVDNRGIVPRRKNIALAIGLAFHAGAEILLRRAMAADGDWILDAENNAVQAALLELEKHTAAGVEVDLQEQPEKKASNDSWSGGDIQMPGTLGPKRVADQQTREQADSPIVIDFGGSAEVDRVDFYTTNSPSFSDPIYAGSSSVADAESAQLAEIEIHDAANEAQATGVDDYLRLELAALTEAMVRAYARRRLKPLIFEYEILEVEREGSWLLSEYRHHAGLVGHADDGSDCDEYCGGFDLHWMSRHDGLLLERATNSLYLLSFKTTGAWDRRKKADAEIDMQGLSEAVDVEKRLARAWEIAQDDMNERSVYLDEISALVSGPVFQWLHSQPAPPKILGVRYEYILKGARREDKKFNSSGTEAGRRWVQDSPLIRAYKSEGITSSDRRWAPKYEWFDITGKERRIDYRSWKKAAVWESMPIAAWIDRLDARDFWPGEDGYDQAGNAMDVLGDQFVPPVVVYRNEDDMRDLLEQLEAQEVGVALAVEEVRRAEKEGEGAKRSALNRLFPQNRSACLWPGPCSFMPVCYGGEDIRRDPLQNSELYQAREANHPIEMGGESE